MNAVTTHLNPAKDFHFMVNSFKNELNEHLFIESVVDSTAKVSEQCLNSLPVAKTFKKLGQEMSSKT